MRHAFTLIELLVVIGILALLAAMLLPAITGAASNAEKVQDSNQMKEIARAVLIWRNDIGKPSSLIFPRKIMNLARNGGPLDGDTTVFVSPADLSGGQDETLNADRIADGWDPADIHEPGCSYAYECSDEPSPWKLTFVPNGVDVPDEPTWEDYKIAQKHYGNLDEDGEPAPFSEDVIPLLRNFYHHDWASGDPRTSKEVLNVTWSTRVYKSIPKWEHQANPDIPIDG